MSGVVPTDEELVEIFLQPIRKCEKYRPAFGQGKSDSGLTVSEFTALYGGDPFYSWLGLNAPVIYAAHKAAGGLTSLYRQVGVGSERLVRRVVGDVLALPTDSMLWRYSYTKADGKVASNQLDVRISLNALNEPHRGRFEAWLQAATEKLLTRRGATKALAGAVFEVRQGYKSADSKRQNADLRFGIHAYQEDLLPVVLVLSSQVSAPVIARYRADGMLVLTGVLGGGALISSLAFFDDVIEYSLSGFFERNHGVLKAEITRIVASLLRA